MSDEPGKAVQEVLHKPRKPSRPRKRRLTRQQKLRYFLAGFLGWWLVNVPLYLVVDRVQGVDAAFIFIFILNVLVPISLASTHRWAALGIAAAIALNLVISVFLGLIFNVLCWIPFTTPYQ